MDRAVAHAFDAVPLQARAGTLALRQLILEVATSLPEVGPVEESLRWGEPAYLTPTTRSGSTIRPGAPKAGGVALYCHCRTSLIADFRDLAGEACRFAGNRAVLFDDPSDIDPALIGTLIARALTWHRRGGHRRGGHRRAGAPPRGGQTLKTATPRGRATGRACPPSDAGSGLPSQPPRG